VLDGDGEDRRNDGLLTAPEGVTAEFAGAFVAAIAHHRFWDRAGKNRLGAPGDETRGRGALPTYLAASPLQSAER
jgi:hypothetical protein